MDRQAEPEPWVNPHANPLMRDQVRSLVHSMGNAASLRGLAWMVAGGVVLLTPGASTLIAEIIVISALGIAGLMDVFYALTGRRWIGRRLNRVLAFFRGLAGIVFVALLIALAYVAGEESEISLYLVVAFTGYYLVVRGIITIISALIRRKEQPPALAVGGGLISVVAGVLAALVPAGIAQAAIATGAVLGLVLGAMLVAWGVRREARADDAVPANSSVSEILWDWIRMADIGRAERAEQSEPLYFEEPERYDKLGAWWVMLTLSVAIATFAVLADSTAVVIGAMLVAPLMTPIVALAGALVNGWKRRALQSATLVALGVASAVALSAGLSGWAPVAINADTNSQIISRVSPTPLDMLVALAAGAAGAFATVNKRVSSGIAGVAIAVALVPPLSVVGISLGEGRLDDAGGAFLLFLTNFVAIVLAAGLVFVATGFARPKVLRRRPRQILATVLPFVALAGVVLVPLMLTAEGQLAASGQARVVEKTVQDWLGEDSSFATTSITVTGQTVNVSLAGAGETPPAEDLQQALIDATDLDVRLRLTVTPVEVTVLEAPGP